MLCIVYLLYYANKHQEEKKNIYRYLPSRRDIFNGLSFVCLI